MGMAVGGGGAGIRASDIGGVGGPTATPAPGPSPQRHRLPLSPLTPVKEAASVLILYCNKTHTLSPAPTLVAQWLRLLPMIRKVLGSNPAKYIFESD